MSGPDTESPRILAVVPARAGSKRIPNKNIRELAGRPLLCWTIDTALESGLFCDVLMTSDSEEAARIATEAGALVPFLRPPELAADDTPSMDVVLHAAEEYGREFGDIDAIMLLQPTSPFRRVETMRHAVEEFRLGNGASVVSISSLGHHPDALVDFDCKTKVVRRAGRDCSPGGLADRAAINGLLYLTSTSVLAKGRLLSDPCIGLHCDDRIESIDIDTPSDWRLASCVAESMKGQPA